VSSSASARSCRSSPGRRVPDGAVHYLIAMEVAWPDAFGPGISVYKQFNANMAALLQNSPYLTQHRDSVLVYLTSMRCCRWRRVPVLPFAPTVSAVIVTGIARAGRR